MAIETEKILSEISEFSAQTLEEVEAFRVKYLGKKGIVKDLSSGIKDVAPENRKAFGQSLNSIKTAVTDRIEEIKSKISQDSEDASSGEDLTRPTGGRRECWLSSPSKYGASRNRRDFPTHRLYHRFRPRDRR